MNCWVLTALAGSMLVTLSLCSMRAYAEPISEIDSRITIDLSFENIQLAILKAGAMRGWEITEKAPGHLEGVVRVEGIFFRGTQVLVIDIRFNKTRYSIRHNRSENMDYKNGKIHKNFNKWVQLLDGDIQAMLTYM